MTGLTIRYKVGNENNPSDPWGRSELVIHADGSARLDHYFSRRGPLRAWTGRVDAAALDELRAALGQAGFPAVPSAGPLPSGAAVRWLTVEAGGTARQAAVTWDQTSSLPGYATAFDIIDAVIRQLSGDTVRYPTQRGPVVHDAAISASRISSETSH
jgi:hypothetical protein